MTTLGVIGLGRIGAFHTETLSGLPGVDRLIVADERPDVVAAVAAKHGAQPADSVEELLASGVDGVVVSAATPALAQKRGGTLRLYHNDTPPSTSLLEESTIASVTPFAAIFNNLVVFDPARPHESLDTVIGDLAESWSWDATNTKLTFKLHSNV